jgi:hypothetical protein
LVGRQGATGVGGAVADWLEREAAKWIAPHTTAAGLVDFVFAFHDREEIGPRMLARIAKRTGLSENDL